MVTIDFKFIFNSHEHTHLLQISFSQHWTVTTCFMFHFHKREQHTFQIPFSQPRTHTTWVKFLLHSPEIAPYASNSFFTAMNTICFWFLFIAMNTHYMLQISFSQPWTHTICFQFLLHSHEIAPYASKSFFTAMKTVCFWFLFTAMNTLHMLQISFSQPRTHNICFKFLFHSLERTPYASNFFFTTMNTAYPSE
jgi:hypothetical protein